MARYLLALLLTLWASAAQAQVVFDNCSESHTGTTGSVSEASFSWSHTPVGTPAGVVVFVTTLDAFTDNSSAVSYGAGSLTAVTGGAALLDAAEDSHVKAYFLGSGLATGAQTVAVTRTNNARILYATACTVTAGGNTEVHEAGIVLVQANGTITEQSVTDGSPGTNSVRFSHLTSGSNAVTSAGANSTTRQSIDVGAVTSGVVSETTAGQGARSIGWAGGGATDNVAVHLAIKQAAGGGGSPATCSTFTLFGVGKCG